MTGPPTTPDGGGRPWSAFHLGLWARLRAYFFAGVLITAPIALTLYLSWLLVSVVDTWVAGLLPKAYNPNTYLPFGVPGIGLLLVFVTLTLIGAVTAGVIGRWFQRLSESIVHRTPIVRSVYTAIKQIFETLLSERTTVFRQVVLVEFPRKGLWRIGFVTGTTPGATQEVVPGGLVNVFIPSTANATGGFLVLCPPGDLIGSDLSVEEALKLIVSGGIAVPPAKPRPLRQPERISLTAESRSNR